MSGSWRGRCVLIALRHRLRLGLLVPLEGEQGLVVAHGKLIEQIEADVALWHQQLLLQLLDLALLRPAALDCVDLILIHDLGQFIVLDLHFTIVLRQIIVVRTGHEPALLHIFPVAPPEVLLKENTTIDCFPSPTRIHDN